jgi:uncharacterized protein (DUF885 family)
MSKQEVDRYTIRMPGQATSYYYGYTRWMEIRQEAERVLGSKFNLKSFHDFMLAQGLLPSNLLREAVIGDYVKGVNRAGL